jgi:hypothetical protein
LSTQISPDGMYYWDGQAWVSTLSHDGMYRWNGAAWVPLGGASAQAFAPAGGARRPTSWTRPLQLAVIAYYTLTGLYGALSPVFLYGPMRDYLHTIAAQSMRQAQQSNPGASPPPDVTPFFDAMLPWMLGLSAVFAVAIALVVVIGALSRWRWLYYALIVLLGLGVLGLPFTIAGASGVTPAGGGFPGPMLGSSWVSVVFSILGAALFVWMLVALVKRGPWAMTRQAP